MFKNILIDNQNFSIEIKINKQSIIEIHHRKGSILIKDPKTTNAK